MIKRRQARPMTALVLACLLALAMPAASFAAANDVTAIKESDKIYFYSSYDVWTPGLYANYAGDHMLVELWRSGTNNTETITVDYTTVDGTAQAGIDYVHTSGTLTFGPHQYMKEIIIPVLNPAPGVYDAGYKTASIELSSPTGTVDFPDGPSAELRVYDPEASLSFNTSEITISEDGYIDLLPIIKAERITPVEARIVVVGGTAAEGKDFAISNDRLYLWPLNDDTDYGEYDDPRMGPINDNEVEGDETIELAWASDNPHVLFGSPSVLTITIKDDDTNNPPVLQFKQSHSRAVEDSGQLNLTVIRADGHKGPTAVNYTTINGSADDAADYTPVSGTLEFLEHEYEKTITVPITDDSAAEYAEQFQVQLSIPPGGNAVLGTPDTAVVTILDDDLQSEIPAGQKIQFLRDAYFISESIGAITVTVERSGGSSGVVSVDYCTCSVTAKSGKDFTSKTGTLVFQEGETRKTITIPVLNDTQHEPDELFRVKLQNVQGSAVLGDKQLTSITIEDDDQ